MDGLVTTFAIVTSAVGASLSPGIILIVGFANVFADAFSMGASSYLSAKAEESIHEHARIKRPIGKSIVTFVSFVVVGVIPLVPFIVATIVPTFSPYAVMTSVGATMIAFAGVGYTSGSLLGKNPFITAMRNVFIGGAAAIIAFGVGRALATMFGI